MRSADGRVAGPVGFVEAQCPSTGIQRRHQIEPQPAGCRLKILLVQKLRADFDVEHEELRLGQTVVQVLDFAPYDLTENQHLSARMLLRQLSNLGVVDAPRHAVEVVLVRFRVDDEPQAP